MANNLHRQHYSYSSYNITTLSQLRRIAPNIYLGLIWDPSPASLEQIHTSRKSLLPFFQSKAYRDTLRQRKNQKRYQLSTKKLKQAVGKNAGLHVDIRSYMKHPSILSHSRRQGIAVATYSANGPQYHIKQLSTLPEKLLPDVVISSAASFALCSATGNAIASVGRTGHLPNSSLGSLVKLLPADADFAQLNKQQRYYSEGLYVNAVGIVRSLASAKKQKKRSPWRNLQGPQAIPKDQGMKNNVQPIIISVPEAKP